MLTSKASTRKCRAKKKPLEEEIPEDQTLITSAERKKRKGELQSLGEVLQMYLSVSPEHKGSAVLLFQRHG